MLSLLKVMMFSATSSAESEAATSKWLRKPVRVHIGSCAANISSSVVQAIHVCAEHKKPQKLMKHLQKIKVPFLALHVTMTHDFFFNRGFEEEGIELPETVSSSESAS